jgi:hypothetical protein
VNHFLIGTSFQELNKKSRFEKSERISIGINLKSEQISIGTNFKSEQISIGTNFYWNKFQIGTNFYWNKFLLERTSIGTNFQELNKKSRF